MADELKVAVAPEAAEVVESLIDNRRAAIENAVIAENETKLDPPADLEEAPKLETPKEEAKPVEPDPVQRIKDAVQKRIDKVVAQKKSVEEENAELRAENARLKAVPKPAEIPAPKDDTPPTIEQVEAYIEKMSEEGNLKEVSAATRYLIKLEKEAAFKEIEAKQNKVQTETDSEKARVDSEMKMLASDYVVYNGKGEPDSSHDLTLSNQKGLLFRTALSLYNDKDLHKDHYNDPNVVNGFRRAVADAYRELHQQGLIAPKGERVAPRIPREVLADPDAATPEEVSAPSQSPALSDADKVREELINRKKNRFLRTPS